MQPAGVCRVEPRLLRDSFCRAMASIRILADRVANQIAAGEVIERPAAVVKELVENSLDAGATRIEVEFRAGGRAHIRVEDNGGGMTRDDALLSLSATPQARSPRPPTSTGSPPSDFAARRSRRSRALRASNSRRAHRRRRPARRFSSTAASSCTCGIAAVL